MKNLNIILIVFIIISIQICPANPNRTDKSKILSEIGSTQIPFITNMGQVDKSVKFYARTFGGTVYVTENGEVVYSLPESKNEDYNKTNNPGNLKITRGVSIREQFNSIDPAQIFGENPTATEVNFYRGTNKSKWKSNIRTYQIVNLGKVSDKISLKLKAFGDNVEKLFFLEQGANPDNIIVKLDGTNSLSLSDKGELELGTDFGFIKFTKPVAYQEIQEKKEYVNVAYWVKDNTYGFTLGEYDKTKGLVIDPLIASTFLGGSYDDGENYVYVNANENQEIYVTGGVHSYDLPITPGAYDKVYNGGDSDVFISKFNSDLSILIASTYFGGNEIDYATSLFFDKNGDVIIAGSTESNDLPITDNAYDGSFNSTPGGLGYERDVFIAKFNSDLSNLLASTYLGGMDEDGIYNTYLNMDNAGNIYVSSSTYSTNFPTTPNAYNTSINDVNDVFIAKFDNTLSKLSASTLIGSRGWDQCYSIELDSHDNVYICGIGGGPDFPTTPGAYQTNWIWYGDAYIAKFDTSLSTLLASTYLGGSHTEDIFDMVLDQNDNVYVTGETQSSDFPVTHNAYDLSFNGGTDIFVSKLDGDLTTLQASTYLGGSGFETYLNASLTLDKDNNIYVTSGTGSPDFPVTENAYDTDFDGYFDVFISKFNNDLKSLTASTFIGGEYWDFGNHIISFDQNILVVGQTYSSTFPTTPGAYDEIYNLNGDIFISIFDRDLSGRGTTNISNNKDVILPSTFKLYSNYPNPFNPVTNIKYDLPSASHIQLAIFDLSGKKIKTLINDTQNAGYHSVTWNGIDRHGNSVASGIYIYKIMTEEFTESKKCMLIK